MGALAKSQRITSYFCSCAVREELDVRQISWISPVRPKKDPNRQNTKKQNKQLPTGNKRQTDEQTKRQATTEANKNKRGRASEEDTQKEDVM